MAMFVSGCATSPLAARNECFRYYDGALFCNNYEVEFISDPPGAKIEVNNNYIGETPLKQFWNGLYDRWTIIKIVAYPIQAGQYTQSKSFFASDGLPRKVYFNMNLVPNTPSLDVNINNQ